MQSDLISRKFDFCQTPAKSELERNWKLKAALSRLSQRFSNGTATYKHRLLLCEPRLKETNTGSQSPGTFSWPQFSQLMPFFILPCWIFQWKNISNVFSDLRFLLFWWKRFLGRISPASLLLIGLPHPLSYIPNPLNEPLFHFQTDNTTDLLINKIDGLVAFWLQWRGTNSKFQTSHFCWINYHIGNREGFILVRQRGIIQIYNSRPSMIFRTPPFHDQISGPWCQLQRNGGNGFHPAPWGITNHWISNYG